MAARDWSRMCRLFNVEAGTYHIMDIGVKTKE